jgi:hypothetical protein
MNNEARTIPVNKSYVRKHHRTSITTDYQLQTRLVYPMPARNRAFSENDAAAAYPKRTRKRRLPLTAVNLLLQYQHSHSCAPSPPETPSAGDADSVSDDMPSRSTSPTRNSDERTKLNAYQIHIDRHHAFPANLAAYISRVSSEGHGKPPLRPMQSRLSPVAS